MNIPCQAKLFAALLLAVPVPPEQARSSALQALRTHGARLAALWALPSLAIAVVSQALNGPPAMAEPSVGAAMFQVLQLMAALYVALFVIVLFAGPAAGIVQGEPLGKAARAAARPEALGIAALMALMFTFALLLPTVPGRLAAFVNPLMAEIFLAVGGIGGAALAVGLFGRWMYAPGLVALENLPVNAALDASHARARRERNFGFALGLSALFAVLASAGGALAVAVSSLQPLLAPLASWLGVWTALVIVPAAVGVRLSADFAPTPSAPTLALRSRPSRCPRCGALAQASMQGSPQVRCPGCGLQAVLR